MFDLIDDMLLKLYFIYEKSPKKCRELEEIISDLGEFVSFTDKGIKPLRASGSRWISHKLSAMQRITSKYGAYTSHLVALSQDYSVRSTDRSKLHGYCKQWVDAKYLLGCALFIDLLSPCAIFSKVMQADEIDILGALMSFVRSLKEIEKLMASQLSQWPTYSATLRLITNTTYQGQELKRFDEAQRYYENHFQEYCLKVKECLKSRLAWSNQQLIRDIITLLATQGWEKLVRECIALEGLDRVVSRFTIPLQGSGIDCTRIHEEFELMMQYAVDFISLSTLEYRCVWWRLFNSPSSSEWSNALGLAELLLSLPASNGKLERIFSQMNVIKTSKRSQMSNDTLDDLLLLTGDGVTLANFCPDSAIDCWWKDKQRRPLPPKQKQKSTSTSETTSNSTPEASESHLDSDFLSEWDTCFNES